MPVFLPTIRGKTLKTERPSKTEKVLGIDLSPSISRLAVCVVHDGRGHAKPIYLSAEKLIRKAMRTQKEIDRLEHRIDEAYRRRDFARLRHLFEEQKRRRHKLKAGKGKRLLCDSR